MTKSKSRDGCIVIPGTQVAAMAVTLVFIIAVVAVGATLNVDLAEVGAMLLGISSMIRVVTWARVGRRPIGNSATA